MSGEEGYRPSTVDTTKSRRAFLKDTLKIGTAGAIGAIAGKASERLTGQQPNTAEAAPLIDNEPQKVIIFESSNPANEPIEAEFKILSDETRIKAEDLNKVSEMPFGPIGVTATFLSQRLIQMAMNGQSLSQEQRDSISQACGDLQAKFNEIVAPKSPGKKT